MIYLDNFKHTKVKHNGKIRRNKLYFCTCNNCGSNKGYKPKNYKTPFCNLCSHKDIKLSKEIKRKMSEAATKRYNDPSWEPKDRSKKGHHKNTTRLYKKIKSPLQSRLSKNMRCLLSVKLRRRGMSKFRQKTFNLLGYSVDELILHLESKFQLGMTWNNYGEWEIDHIKPDSWFKYESFNDLDFKDSWELNNLRPLWKSQNASDGARLCLKQ